MSFTFCCNKCLTQHFRDLQQGELAERICYNDESLSVDDYSPDVPQPQPDRVDSRDEYGSQPSQACKCVAHQRDQQCHDFAQHRRGHADEEPANGSSCCDRSRPMAASCSVAARSGFSTCNQADLTPQEHSLKMLQTLLTEPSSRAAFSSRVIFFGPHIHCCSWLSPFTASCMRTVRLVRVARGNAWVLEVLGCK